MSGFAPVAAPPDLKRLREIYRDKIAPILAPINREYPAVKASFTLGQFIMQSYFPRLDYRLKVSPDDEVHIEPATSDFC